MEVRTVASYITIKSNEGTAPLPSASISLEMRREMLRLMRNMQKEVIDEIKTLWKHDTLASRQALELGYASDADNIAETSAALIARLLDKWTPIFDRQSELIASRMVNQNATRSTRQLGSSVKSISSVLTLPPVTDNPALTVLMDAATQEAAALIKRVPREYLPNVQQDVMRSITTGSGLKDLIPALRERNVKVNNWARNVSLDQTRKAYATINRARMQQAGIRKFKWLHSGGANEPRKHHLHKWPNGLNGGIFSWDDPPIIDPRTGEKGYPGQAPYCGCVAVPYIEDETE